MIYNSGLYCFCGELAPDPAALDASASGCTALCAGNAAEMCGGPAHVNVYSEAFITGLEFSSDRNVAEVHAQVNFNFKIESAPLDVTFQIDYDDGAGRTEKNATDMENRVYHLPGEYGITLFANDAGNTATVSTMN